MLELSNGVSIMRRQSTLGKLVPSWGRSRSRRPVSPDDGDIEPDMIHIEGGLEEVWHTASEKVTAGPLHQVLVNIVVFFVLTRPVDVGSITAHFEGILDVDFIGPRYRTSFLNLHWILWDKGTLRAGRKYRFDVIAEVPPTAPCSFVSTKGIIEYLFHVNFDSPNKRSDPLEISRSVKVWNPYVVFDLPRPGLLWGGDMESEMVGTTVEISKDLTAFVRYPDQWFNSTSSSSVKF
jgi:hypothetical protein